MKGAFWWIDRWRTSDSYANMNAEQRGVYRELIDELWLRGGLITTDEERLSVLAGGEAVWKRVREVVLSKFEKTPLGYRHDVHDEVFGKAKTFKERQSEKGSKRAAEATRQGGRFTSRPAGTPAESPAENQPSDLRSPISGTASPNPNPDTDPGRVVKAESTATPDGTPVSLSAIEPTETATAPRRLTPQALGIKTDPANFAQVRLAHDLTALVRVYLRDLGREPKDPKQAALELLHDISATKAGKRIEGLDWTAKRGGYVSAEWATVSSHAAYKLADEVYGVDLANVDSAQYSRTPHNATASEVLKSPVSRPSISLTVAPGACPECDSPLRHSTEDGETILRCSDEHGFNCAWAAVWRAVAA